MGAQLIKFIKLIALASLLALSACKARPPAQIVSQNIYPDPSQAQADLAAALQTAAATHKRILLDFGGNWCGDCQVLNIYFHDPSNLPILQKDYVLVDINVGHLDANVDLAEKYGIPLHKGVPALAVLDEHGNLLYSQKGGEFEDMRQMQSSAVTSFLDEWRPACSAVVVNC